MVDRFGMRWRTVVRLAVAALLVPVVGGLRTPTAEAIDESFVFVTSLSGHQIGNGADYLQQGIVHTTPPPTSNAIRHRFTTTSGPSTIEIEVRAPVGELSVGSFWDLREPEYDELEPGFRLTIDGRTCPTLGGGMLVDDIAFDATGALVSLTLRFAPRCTGESFARLTGTLAYRAAVPTYARRMSSSAGAIRMAPGESRVVPVTFENRGPSPIVITALSMVSQRVLSGSAPASWGATNGTCGQVVASGVTCTIDVYLSSLAIGSAVYSFVTYDSLSANQFGTGSVLFPVGTELTITVETVGAPTSTSPSASSSTAPATSTTTTTTMPSTSSPSTSPSTSSSTSTTSTDATVPMVTTTVPEPRVTIEPDDVVLAEPPVITSAGNAVHGYYPVGPSRVFDTRTRTNVHRSPMRPGERYRFDVVAAAGLSADLVDAVALNVTVAGATGPGYVSVFPSGGEVPDSSNLNFESGRAVANMVIVGVGDGGAIDLLQGPSASELIVDIVGWYGDAPAGSIASAQFTLAPSRVYDTRRAGVPFTGGTSRTLPLGGRGGVPADASAVIVNLTATNVTESTYVTLSPGGEARPTTSSLNVVAGETRPNLAIVRLDRSGAVELFLERGRADLIVDVVGYFAPGNGGTFLPLDPVRVVDTRFEEEPVYPDDLLALGIAENVDGHRVIGVVLNVTATDGWEDGYVSVFPGDATSLPDVSNVNYPADSAVPNLVVTKVGDGAVLLYNALGTVDLLVDVMGLIVV